MSGNEFYFHTPRSNWYINPYPTSGKGKDGKDEKRCNGGKYPLYREIVPMMDWMVNGLKGLKSVGNDGYEHTSDHAFWMSFAKERVRIGDGPSYQSGIRRVYIGTEIWRRSEGLGPHEPVAKVEFQVGVCKIAETDTGETNMSFYIGDGLEVYWSFEPKQYVEVLTLIGDWIEESINSKTVRELTLDWPVEESGDTRQDIRIINPVWTMSVLPADKKPNESGIDKPENSGS